MGTSKHLGESGTDLDPNLKPVEPGFEIDVTAKKHGRNLEKEIEGNWKKILE